MENRADYCAIRSALEEQRFSLVSRLSALTTALAKVIGQNHEAFLVSIAACRRTRVEIANLRREIRIHRIQHHC